MVPTSTQRRPPSPSKNPPPSSLRLENTCSEARTATVLLSTASGEPVAHLVRLSGGESATLPLPDDQGPTTVECHLDGGRGSAVLSVDAGTARSPVLSLQRSSVVLAR